MREKYLSSLRESLQDNVKVVINSLTFVAEDAVSDGHASDIVSALEEHIATVSHDTMEMFAAREGGNIQI